MTIKYRLAVLVVGLAASAGAMAAQAPTDAQKNAIRANCRSDFLSLCKGVTPGGKAALDCLQQNSAQTKPACQQALSALNTAPATSTTSSTMAKPAAR